MSDDIPLRAIAELQRRKAQQEHIMDATDAPREYDRAYGKVEGYETAITVLRELRAVE